MAPSGRSHTCTYPMSVPRAGPASCLGHQVLISKHSEVVIAQDRCQSKTLPANARRHHQQFVLPASPRLQEKLPFSARTNEQLSSKPAVAHEPAGIPLSARELREKPRAAVLEPRMAAKPGLVKGLLRFNQLQHLGFEPDGEVVVKDTAPAAFLEAQAKTKPACQPQAAQTSVWREDSSLSFIEKVEAKESTSRPSMPRKAFGLADLTPEEAGARLDRVRRCFRHSPKEVKIAFDHAFHWSVLPELETDDPPLSDAARKLQALFKEANLPTSLRKSQVAGTDEREQFGDMSSKWSLGSAHKAEITASICFLNFVRWLCGLPKVKVSLSKLAVCRIIGKALLPRSKQGERGSSGSEKSAAGWAGHAPPEFRRHQGKSEQLAKELSSLIEGESVSVLHGEGSLVNGLEQSLCATHMCHLPAIMVKEKDPALSAWNIAQSVRTILQHENNDHGCMHGRRVALNGGDHELPGPLKTLQILWDLHPGDSNAAALRALQKTNATAAIAHAGAVSGRAPGVGTGRRVRKVPAMDFQEEGEEVRATHFGLDSVWGDRKGALSFRRCLLNPSLQSFAAARYDDTCVLWTGHDANMGEEFKDTGGRKKTMANWRGGPTFQLADEEPPEAVCYPPPGLVPLGLVEGAHMPWTIMPDSNLFQPTLTTSVKIWRVQIDRRGDGEILGATRVAEVPILGLAVDCSTTGDSFCVIFWPDLGRFFQPGEQLEVVLSGLCGSKTEITIFHELMSFRRGDSNRALVQQASLLRAFYEDISCLWLAGPGPSSQGGSQQLGRLSPEPPEIKLISHLNSDFTVTSADVVVCVRCEQAHVLISELAVRRFAGETTEVLRGAQTQKLRDHYFLVRVKIPTPRYTYELRFRISTHAEPREMHLHHFQYVITAASSCPTLVRSIEDKLMQKFGFAQLHPETQINGIFLLSPSTYRVSTGQCYFSVLVDVPLALAAARAALPPGVICDEDKETRTKLFSHRLLPAQGSSVQFQEEVAHEVVNMQELLRESLGQYTQDSHGDVHLDLVLHNGEHIQRLREHPDLPGLFESIVNVTDLDVSTKIQMLLRFPHIHACDFSPRTVAEWMVCRADEQVPDNF